MKNNKNSAQIIVEPMKWSDIEEVCKLTAESYEDHPLVKKGFIDQETIKKN